MLTTTPRHEPQQTGERRTFGIEQDSGADGEAVLRWLETGEGQPWPEEQRLDQLRTLSLYRAMGSHHHWAAGKLVALLSVNPRSMRSVTRCRACRGRGWIGSGFPVECSVCSGLGLEVRT